MRNMLATVIASAALIQGCTTMPKLAEIPDAAEKSVAAEMADAKEILSFVGNTDDNHVLTGNGDCLRSIGLSSKSIVVECQASSEMAEKAPEPRQLARLSYDGTALFAFDSAELSSEGRRELSNLVAKLNGNTEVGGIAVVGHADSIGAIDYNQSLSENRAATVRQFLQSALKDIEVKTSGMGETAPVADNTTSAGRQRNRRVEVNINAVESNAVFK